MNLYSVHLDENYWTDPEVFRPERHLNADHTSVVKTDHFLPFGAGKIMAELSFRTKLFFNYHLPFNQESVCVWESR